MQKAKRKQLTFEQRRRRKRVRAMWRAYGNYIIAGCLLAAVVSLVTVAAVTLTSSAGQETEARTQPREEVMAQEVPTQPPEMEATAEPTEEPLPENSYPFNLMSHDWDGEDVAGWKPYAIPKEYERDGGFLPDCMQQFIFIICKQNKVDYAMVLAMIEVESGYKWDAKSSDPSVGYMQVIEKYHKDRMEKLNIDNVENPYFNIMVAVDYLAELQGRFETEEEVLTAYNYGVAGAYKHVWNKGLKETEYSRRVQRAKARIKAQLGGAEE